MSFDLSGDLRRLCPGPCEHPGRTNPQTRGTDGSPDNREAVSGQAGTYRRTRTSFALARICEASRQACIRSNMSILTSKAFSMRSAISGDNAALPFSRSESVARRTPRISAAFVTFKPSSSMTSVRMKSPGWEGVMFTLIVRSKYSADPQVSIVQQVVTVTANRSQALVEPQCFPPLRLST